MTLQDLGQVLCAMWLCSDPEQRGQPAAQGWLPALAVPAAGLKFTSQQSAVLSTPGIYPVGLSVDLNSF